jgi:hypothetical protein
MDMGDLPMNSMGRVMNGGVRCGKRRQDGKSGCAERYGRGSKNAVGHGDLPSGLRRDAPRERPLCCGT